jgi:hypothetical protein
LMHHQDWPLRPHLLSREVPVDGGAWCARACWATWRDDSFVGCSHACE